MCGFLLKIKNDFENFLLSAVQNRAGKKERAMELKKALELKEMISLIMSEVLSDKYECQITLKFIKKEEQK